jgi:Cof subfamily protein (haloacid dehalogenase superfamily)
MARIRLVAFDLDGTLLNGRLQVSPANRQALAAAGRQGIWLVPATSRITSFVRPLAEELQLGGPLICHNGALVLGSPAGPVWSARTLPAADARLVAGRADEQGWELTIAAAETVYARLRPGQSAAELPVSWRAVPSYLAGLEAAAAQGGPLKMMSWDQATIAAFDQMVKNGLLPGCHVMGHYYPDGTIESAGLFPLGVDKGTALRLVTQRLGLAREEVMAIGDNANDLALLGAAGLAVAMENGTPDAKAAAAVIAPSNEADGAAWAIERFALNPSPTPMP